MSCSKLHLTMDGAYNAQVPCSFHNLCNVMAQSDRDLYQVQVLFEEPLFLLLLLLHQKMNFQFLKAIPPRVDQRYCSDLWEIQLKIHRAKSMNRGPALSLYRAKYITPISL